MQLSKKFGTKQINVSYSDIRQGNFHSNFESANKVDENIKKFAKKNHLDNFTLVTTKCGDSTFNSFDFKKDIPSELHGYDAFILKDKTSIIMRVADCPPLLLVDKNSDTVALIHCARESLNKEIIQKAAYKLQSDNPDGEYFAYLGPGIDEQSYVLPASTIFRLKKDWHEFINRVENNDEMYHLDIKGYALELLKKSGLNIQVISVSDINTATNEKFYSNYRATRKNQKNGRNAFTYKIVDL